MTTSELPPNMETTTARIFVPGASVDEVATDISMSYDDISLDRVVDLKAMTLKTRAERIRRINTKYRTAPDMGRLASRQRFVPGQGNVRANVMFIGDMPSGNEALTGRALDGQRRQVVQHLLQGIDCREDQTYTTYLLKYRTPGGRSIRGIEIAGIKHLVMEEIDIIKPSVVVTWGRQVLDSLIPGASLYENHGKILSLGGIPLVPMFSPEAVLLNPEAMRDVRRDFQTIHKFM